MDDLDKYFWPLKNPFKVITLAEGEPAATNNPDGNSITLNMFMEAYRKVEALTPPPSEDVIQIHFPLYMYRERFPKFKALFPSSPLDMAYNGAYICGIPVYFTPAVPYDKVRFIMRDNSIKECSLEGL